MDTAADVVAQAQLLLDPTGQSLYSDKFLLSYANKALTEIRATILSTEVTQIEASAQVLALPPGMTNLDAYTAAGQPLALMEQPLSIREKPAGTDSFNYTDLRRVDRLPARDADSRLGVFEWTGGRVLLLGATQPMDLDLRVKAAWPPLTQMTTQLPVAGLTPAASWWAAALVRQAADSPQAPLLMATATKLLARWTQSRILDSQAVTRRPRPYRDQPRWGEGTWL